MYYKKEDEIEQLKREYPAGTEIILDYMDDRQAPPEGTHGKVKYIDDAGTIHVAWETGSSLGLVAGEDEFHKA